MKVNRTSKCKNCEADIKPFFSLGEMPLVNSFLKSNEDFSKEKRFDLTVAFCPGCYLVQLVKTVSPEEMFRNYVYFSSTSTSFINHCKETASYLSKKLKLNHKNLVLEIASNDGMQLQCFKDIGINILGVDPAENIAKTANEKGISTIPEFFNQTLAKKLKKSGVKADLVFGANVLAHVPEIIDFVKGVKVVLSEKGTAVFEFPYIGGLLENKFDTIYHEHVFYYSLIALKNLFKAAGLKIYDVDKTPMQGGSLRIFVSHPGAFNTSQSVTKLTKAELAGGYDKLKTYQNININVNNLKNDLILLLKKIKSDGKKVAAYGAAAKGTVLLSYFGIEKEIEFIADKSDAKQGLYTPGTHFLVHSPEKVNQNKPDYLLILPWNIADEITQQFQDYHKKGGKFIIPVPRMRII